MCMRGSEHSVYMHRADVCFASNCWYTAASYLHPRMAFEAHSYVCQHRPCVRASNMRMHPLMLCACPHIRAPSPAAALQFPRCPTAHVQFMCKYTNKLLRASHQMVLHSCQPMAYEATLQVRGMGNHAPCAAASGTLMHPLPRCYYVQHAAVSFVSSVVAQLQVHCTNAWHIRQPTGFLHMPCVRASIILLRPFDAVCMHPRKVPKTAAAPTELPPFCPTVPVHVLLYATSCRMVTSVHTVARLQVT
jgi:hypothetical protein